jgi:signal transduction histidine kinase
MDSKPADNPISILHLEDSALDHQLVQRTLRNASMHCTLVAVDTLPDFARMLAQQRFDLILADYRLQGFTALDAWQVLSGQAAEPQPPFVLLSGAIGESAAVAAIHLGMADFIAKQDMATLPRVIQRTLESHRHRQEKIRADQELAHSQQQLAAFSQYLQAAIEQERASIAREIHDDIGGALAAAKLDLAWLGRHGANAEMQNHIQAATEMLDHAIGASRRIMMNLRPSILDQGIFAAVEWLATGFEKRTGIRT